MARKASGTDQLALAQELLRTAKTADELRAAQAVLLPLELGLSLAQTAAAIGRSVSATCKLRTRHCKVMRREREAPRSRHTLRNRAHATLEREAQILDEVLAGAMRGGVVVVPPLKDKIAECLAGRSRSRPSTECWRATAGASWRRTPSIRKATRQRARTGKKLQGELEQIVISWGNDRPLRLMFQDEARFGRISGTRYCWCRRPDRPLVRAMPTQQYTYAYGAVSPQDGCFDSLVLPQVNSDCMQLFIDEVASRHPNDNVVMVLDGAGWHKSKDFKLPDHLRLLFLPPYSPELNPQEHLWNERDFPVPRLRRKPRSATSAMMDFPNLIKTTEGEVHEHYHDRNRSRKERVCRTRGR